VDRDRRKPGARERGACAFGEDNVPEVVRGESGYLEFAHEDGDIAGGCIDLECFFVGALTNRERRDGADPEEMLSVWRSDELEIEADAAKKEL
jgi:hypothetical protein